VSHVKNLPTFRGYVLTLHCLNRASSYIHVRKTYKIHLYLINLFQLNYPLHDSNKVHHHEVISIHAVYSISRASMGYLAANTIRLELLMMNLFIRNM
jgi:hypothetical protein